jgi:uncharacterized protein YbjT (DUF2867 family)
VLVTEATGFIGGHLVRYLMPHDHRVRVLVRYKSLTLGRVAADRKTC